VQIKHDRWRWILDIVSPKIGSVYTAFRTRVDDVPLVRFDTFSFGNSNRIRALWTNLETSSSSSSRRMIYGARLGPAVSFVRVRWWPAESAWGWSSVRRRGCPISPVRVGVPAFLFLSSLKDLRPFWRATNDA